MIWQVSKTFTSSTLFKQFKLCSSFRTESELLSKKRCKIWLSSCHHQEIHRHVSTFYLIIYVEIFYREKTGNIWYGWDTHSLCWRHRNLRSRRRSWDWLPRWRNCVCRDQYPSLHHGMPLRSSKELPGYRVHSESSGVRRCHPWLHRP